VSQYSLGEGGTHHPGGPRWGVAWYGYPDQYGGVTHMALRKDLVMDTGGGRGWDSLGRGLIGVEAQGRDAGRVYGAEWDASGDQCL